jgi:hydroxyacylglutathione hydrolase
MEIFAVRTEGLGDTTYVLVHDGQAVVVDPQRDIDRFESVLNGTDAELRFVLETHLHNDYVSGGKDLAASTGAELVFPAGAVPTFRHRAAFHYEDIGEGALVIRPIHTPGHTPEHTSYLVVVDGEPTAVFSGGSLLVGSAGRSDLLGRDRADSLARLQYRSVTRLADLPDDVGLYPTHGAGSFCTASGAGELTSTIGVEKRTNPVLAHDDEDSFVAHALGGLVPFPSYYRYMGPTNVQGAPPLPRLRPEVIDEAGFRSIESEVVVIDTRPKIAFASGHLRDSLAIELRADFGVWVGWVVPHDSPLVLVMNPDQDVEEAMRQLVRIGLDDVRGVILDLEDWKTEMVSNRLVSVEQFAEAVSGGVQVLDVRAPNEWETGIIADSMTAYAPDVVIETPGGIDPGQPVWLACETGYRASIAASVLASRGFETVVLIDNGVTDVLGRLSNT